MADDTPTGPVEVVSWRRTCAASPSQWEGVCGDGRIVYARYRWGCLDVSIGDTLEEAVKAQMGGVKGRVLLSRSFGGEYDGEMTDSAMMTLTHGLVIWGQPNAVPAPTSPSEATIEGNREG